MSGEVSLYLQGALSLALSDTYTVTTGEDEGGGGLFIFVGQSNMVGCPQALPGDWASDPDIKIWDADLEAFATYDPGVNSFPPPEGFVPVEGYVYWGPELEFARQYRAENPTKTCYIVKYAVGGTALSNTFEGELDWAPTSTGELLDRTTAYVTAALAAVADLSVPDPSVILWMQGESDGFNSTVANAYGTNLTAFLAAARSAWAPGAKFVIGRISLSDQIGEPEIVRAKQAEVVTADGNAVLIDTDALVFNPLDGIHYDTAGLITLGNDMYDAYLGNYTGTQVVNTVAPAITGTETDGSTLTCSTGTWSGSPDTFAYQWKLADGTTIGGATTNTHTAVEGEQYKCTVTASNFWDSTAATSANTGVIGPGAPVGVDLTMVSPLYGAVTGWGQHLYGGYGYCAASALPQGAEITIEAKFAAGGGTYQVLLGQDPGVMIGLTDTGALWYAYHDGASGTGLLSTGVDCDDSASHRVELNIGAAGSHVFVDGVLAHTNGAAFVPLNTSRFAVRDWGDHAGGSLPWTGTVDEVVVWDVVRHTSGFTPPAAPYAGNEGMTHLWHLDGDGTDSVA